MQVYRSTDGRIEAVFSRAELRKLSSGFVVHAYSAPHYGKGKVICALHVELPTHKQYIRLGYTPVRRYTLQDIKGNRLRIGSSLEDTAAEQAAICQEQAEKLAAMATTDPSIARFVEKAAAIKAQAARQARRASKHSRLHVGQALEKDKT